MSAGTCYEVLKDLEDKTNLKDAALKCSGWLHELGRGVKDGNIITYSPARALERIATEESLNPADKKSLDYLRKMAADYLLDLCSEEVLQFKLDNIGKHNPTCSFLHGDLVYALRTVATIVGPRKIEEDGSPKYSPFALTKIGEIIQDYNDVVYSGSKIERIRFDAYDGEENRQVSRKAVLDRNHNLVLAKLRA